MKFKVLQALIGLIPSAFQLLLGLKKSEYSAIVSVLNSSLKSASPNSSTALPNNNFNIDAESLQALCGKCNNKDELTQLLAELALIKLA